MPRSHHSRRSRKGGGARKPAGRPARKLTSRRVVRFAMPSRREAVVPAVDRILRAARAATLGRGRLPDLAIALAEALSNAAVHGNRLDPALSVAVTVTVQPGRVSVDIADRGPGFDANDVNDPTQPDRLLIPGGRGVLLMQRFADSVVYNPAGNAVRLTMRRRPPARA